MENTMNKYGKYRCPCCGYYTLTTEANNSFQLCPVCYWEDDGIQLEDPEYKGGANEMSLNEVRENFKHTGAVSIGFINLVRSPTDKEKES